MLKTNNLFKSTFGQKHENRNLWFYPNCSVHVHCSSVTKQVKCQHKTYLYKTPYYTYIQPTFLINVSILNPLAGIFYTCVLVKLYARDFFGELLKTFFGWRFLELTSRSRWWWTTTHSFWGEIIHKQRSFVSQDPALICIWRNTFIRNPRYL